MAKEVLKKLVNEDELTAVANGLAKYTHDEDEKIRKQLAAADITIDTTTTSEGKLKSYTFKKGENVLGVIDIEKDLVNGVIGFVSEDGDGNKGSFLKVKTSAVGDPDTFDYLDASSLVEYLTDGSKEGDMFRVNIDADHKLTITATDGTINKEKLTSAVQSSLDAADSALQEADFDTIGTDKANAIVTAAIAAAETPAQSGD